LSRRDSIESNASNSASVQQGAYKRRHHVENFFQRLKRYRRIGTRYEKLARNFFAMVCLAATLIWLR
jgi:transposase